jgi:hypothetical protein
VVDRADAGLLAGLDLVPDVHLRGRIVADEDGRQSGRAVELGHLGLDPGPHVRRNRLPVDDACGDRQLAFFSGA